MTILARLQNIIESPRFTGAIMTAIIVNAAVIGLETVPSVNEPYGPILSALDTIAIAIFVAEIAAKLIVYRHRFFTSGWNVFDLVIVAAALIPASREFSVLRALRILRVLRLISVVPKMRQVVQGLLSAIPAMGSVILLLALIFYVFATMATKLFGERFPEWFGSIGASLYSLFQIMTLESWSMGIVRPVMEQYPAAWIFFVPFILITSFVVLNLFIAIIVNAMHESQDEAETAERDAIMQEIKALHAKIDTMAGN
ncbi:ion transporter [Parasphingopyxis algicola]|uniref:ion transporter n=1 Tax=Parasphingopyxis algicola TaxID=2026624 RepID=UPI0015A494BF|nr:ion transporter [Parasphingopyxis algicola]QLC25230.1 ion transporter [Parasphingopyxis algicola]